MFLSSQYFKRSWHREEQHFCVRSVARFSSFNCARTSARTAPYASHYCSHAEILEKLYSAPLRNPCGPGPFPRPARDSFWIVTLRTPVPASKLSSSSSSSKSDGRNGKKNREQHLPHEAQDVWDMEPANKNHKNTTARVERLLPRKASDPAITLQQPDSQEFESASVSSASLRSPSLS